MFTVGIFTTHIPYIAFVVFYAWFFVTGIDKALSGEIQSGENILKTELYANANYSNSNTENYQYYWNNSEAFKYSGLQNYLFRQKIIYPEFSYPEFQNEYYSNSLFSRPPPLT